MAKRGITLHNAKVLAEREMGRPVKQCGFEHREVGGNIVNILFFSCEYEEIGKEYRMQIFINGKRRAGVIIDE